MSADAETTMNESHPLRDGTFTVKYNRVIGDTQETIPYF